jgi:uncharacterized protein (DUF2235 family)
MLFTIPAPLAYGTYNSIDWSKTMSKRIAYCSDGTWQTAMSNTNVYRLYKAMLVTSDQVTFYDDGVGADLTGLNKILGGAIGAGLNQKIMDAYTSIAHVYEPGDEIFLFGFSRGAYTVRSLGGMIANCGLPSGSFTDDCVTQAFAAYRDPVNRAGILGALSACGLADATITMIGVWDTVGALGIPALYGGIDEKEYGFLDLKLHPDVKHAYHSLAIDEHRPQFPATLWDPLPPTPSGQTPTQTLEQVWFTGCHGDVGGGTLVGGPVDNGTRLCDISMAYMVSKAQANGIQFDPTAIAHYSQLTNEDALDIIRESWAPQDGPVHLRPIPAGSNVSNSVALRIQYALTYLPGNLTIADGAIAAAYNQVTLVDPDAL